MTCEEVKKELALRLVGLGESGKVSEIEAHAKGCSECAARWEKVRAAERAIEAGFAVGDRDFEASWRAIAARSFESEHRGARPFLDRRWALAGGIVMIFVLGAVAGRVFVFGPKKAPAPAELSAGLSPESSWREYANRLELLLVDIGNRAEMERPAAFVRQERAFVEHILAETRSLKSLLEGREEDVRLSLLREAEALLAKIADLQTGDRNSERSMAKIVRESPLKARLRAVGSSELIF